MSLKSRNSQVFENDRLDKSSRNFLESAIGDYNAIFKMNFDTSANEFQNYYKDLSDRVKKREIDLLIVVNMFLTGFDATTLKYFSSACFIEHSINRFQIGTDFFQIFVRNVFY